VLLGAEFVVNWAFRLLRFMNHMDTPLWWLVGRESALRRPNLDLFRR